MLVLAYQQEATIEQAIRGALAQTYTPLEIVISDDASTDSTWDTIQRAVAGYGGTRRLLLRLADCPADGRFARLLWVV